MQTASQALNAAIAHFASQPGTTPAQVDQLRSALLAEQSLLASYNAAAASGALSGFAVGTAPTQHIPSGQFDKGSGIVTLPPSSFLPAGASPTADLGSVLHVQAMVVEFSSKSYADASGVRSPVSADMVSNLQDTLNGSPALAMEIKRAAVTPNPADPTHRILESFDFTAPKAGVGGSYSPSTQTMNLPSVALSKAGYDANDMTFVIGHEVQHGFDTLDAANGRSNFIRDAQVIAAAHSPVHDYTRPVENYIQSGRDDEARAEIAGWNALQSRVHQTKPTATLQDIDRAAPGRARDFLTDQGGLAVTPRTNVQLNSDQTMSPTPSNVAAMGHNYFDRPTAAHKAPTDDRQSMALGGVSDYPNYYARWAVATASWAEQSAPLVNGQKPQIEINMAHAGLYEEMMERGSSQQTSRSLPGQQWRSGDNSSFRPYLGRSQPEHLRSGLAFAFGVARELRTSQGTQECPSLGNVSGSHCANRSRGQGGRD